jgi:hypothetical protein
MADSLISSSMSRFGLAAGAATSGGGSPYMGPGGLGSPGGKFSELTPHQRAALYWPGIQGLISNPAVWRDRFVLSSKFIFNT